MRSFLKLKIFEKIIIILFTLSVTILINYFVNYHYKTKYSDWSDLIRISQRNSTLIEQLYIYTIQLKEDQEKYSNKLEETVGLFDKSLLVLKKGGIAPGFEENNIRAYKNKNIKFLLNEIEIEWIVINNKIYKLLGTPVFLLKQDIDKPNRIQSSINPQYTKLSSNIFELKNDLLSYNEQLIIEYNLLKEIKVKSFKYWQIIILAISLGIVFLLVLFIQNQLFKPIQQIKKYLISLQKGESHLSIENKREDELGEVEEQILKLNEKLNNLSKAITEIGSGNLDIEYQLSGKRDQLGKAIIRMLNHLKNTQKENEKIRIEEEQQNWITSGLAKFADILRKSDKGTKDLAYNILVNLLEYIDAVQGGIYMHQEDELEGENYLELISSYAYDREKHYVQRLEISEGLIGACYQEQDIIYLTDIPENYINITSGLGDANPNSLIIIPLIYENKVLGIIELASLNKFENYQIEFIKKLSENIAITLSSTAINERTSRLLFKAQEQSEELQSQEEEMRQNLEEMQATQEEAHKRSVELHDIVEAINNSAGTYEISSEGNFIRANKIYLDTLGMSEREIIGASHKSFIEQNFSSSSAYDEFMKKIKKGFVQKKEMKYKINDKIIWMSETYTPVHDMNDEVSKILIIAYNITSNKELGHDVKEKYDELHKKEEESDAKFNELNEKIQEYEVEYKKSKEESESLNNQIKIKEQEIIELQEKWQNRERELIEKIKELGQEKRTLKEEKAEHLTEDFEKDFIVWYNKYNLQIPEMDEQHKRIVKLVNEFKEAWDTKKSVNELVKIIKNLINYSSYHFRSEEEYMGEYKYTEIKEHKAEHKKLNQLLQKVEKDLSKNKQDQVQDNLESIKKQFIYHFTESDSKYIDTFKMFGH